MLHRCLAGLSLCHQAGDLGQGRFSADPGGPDHEPARGVDGRARHVVARPHIDRYRLACEHGGIDGRDARLDQPVSSDFLPRAHYKAVTDSQPVHRYQHLVAVPPKAGLFGAQA